MRTAYEDIVGFLASGPMPQDILDYRPPDWASERLEMLVYREKTTGLSPDERSEVDTCLTVEHILRLARAHARIRLKGREAAIEDAYTDPDAATEDADVAVALTV